MISFCYTKRAIKPLCLLCLPCCLFAQKQDNGMSRFIKGDIHEKAAVVSDALPDNSEKLPLAAIDFSLENSKLLGDDDDLSALALSAVTSLPASAAKSGDAMYSKLYELFSTFTADATRAAIIDKLVQFYGENPSENTVAFFNAFLLQSASDPKKSSGETEKTLAYALGTIGNGASFTALYGCLRARLWPQNEETFKTALAKLADKSLPDLVKIISRGDTKELQLLFDIIDGSSIVSGAFKAEISENILSELLYISEPESELPDNVLALEFSCVDAMSANDWVRASSLVLKFFARVKGRYNAGKVSESDFIRAVRAVAALSSTDAAKTLSSYLEELNVLVERGGMSPQNVTLVVIDALGKLGNRVAFDSLLYVTYLDYPSEVVSAAKDALSKIKW